VVAVERALSTATARRVRLQAIYHDTADRRLAAAGLALRLRKEGRRWVQTLKGRGDGLLGRLEHNVLLPAVSGTPVVDAARHAGTPAGNALQAALGTAPLVPIFETDVRRLLRTVERAGTAVEIAFDRGTLRAGDRKAPVCELEFELVRGRPQELLALAARWIERHGLWIDVRSKAERGERLTRGDAVAAPCGSELPALSAVQPLDDALRAIVRACVQQVFANAGPLIDGAATAEHVHQLRVGLRRWRTAWRELPSTSAPVDPALPTALADLFRRLNAARDRDVLFHTVAPALAAAGAPPLPSLAAGAGDGEARRDAAALLRGASTQTLWLGTLAWLDGAAAAGANSATIEAVARRRLRRLHRRVLADAASFASFDDMARHRLRKRVKRLRYLAEFMAVLYRPRATARTLRSLRDAQDALGELCDLVVARGLLAARVENEPQAWFALGWVAAQRPLAVDRCGRALKRLAATKPFWRHPA
jgi:inorganic triphosphatase YgiF